MRIFAYLTILLLLSGCGLFRAAGPESTPTVIPVPTFTPTAESAEPAAAQPASPETTAEEPTSEDASEPVSLLPTTTAGAEADTDDGTAAPEATTREIEESTLVVEGEIVNVRRGPGTEYVTLAAIESGATYTPSGRNEAGDWWQVCCFEGEPGWLYSPLVEVTNGELVAIAADIPPAPTATPAPAAVEESAPEPVAEAPAEAIAPPADSRTVGSFDPAAQYHIVGYRVIGYGENNGGIFNNGGQHMIFVNVIDAAGNGIDGAIVKNAINDNIEIVTGPKGPGRAEFEMFWDPYKLYVASDPSGPVTSQVTNQMNTAHPHIPDIVGRLGPTEEEYAICPTPDDRCEPPFFHAHWSYEVVFQKVNP